MSRRYVYAILDRVAVVPAGLTGIGERPVSTVPYRDLTAATSPLEPGELQATVANAMRHEQTVEALRRAGPLLPVRFGTIFPDAEGVANALAERYVRLEADLRRLGDKVEYGLTVMWCEGAGKCASGESGDSEDDLSEATGDPGPGTRYLRGRLLEYRRASSLRERAIGVAEIVHRALGPHALDERRTIMPGPRIALRVAYLLLPAGVSDFQAAFDDARRTQPELRFLLSGPWPPYSFVTVEAQDGAAQGTGG